MLTSSGDIEPVDPATISPQGDRQMTDPSPRDIIVEGFLVGERSYVANLERLLEFKTKIERDDSLRNDNLNEILSSLNPIVDFQRRFLFMLEMTARRLLDGQTWAYSLEAWSITMSTIYANFITSEKGASEYIRNVLAEGQRVEDEDLNSALTECLRLLALPSQHLPKYSGFLVVRPL
jgi:hypothetical protein